MESESEHDSIGFGRSFAATVEDMAAIRLISPQSGWLTRGGLANLTNTSISPSRCTSLMVSFEVKALRKGSLCCLHSNSSF